MLIKSKKKSKNTEKQTKPVRTSRYASVRVYVYCICIFVFISPFSKLNMEAGLWVIALNVFQKSVSFQLQDITQKLPRRKGRAFAIRKQEYNFIVVGWFKRTPSPKRRLRESGENRTGQLPMASNTTYTYVLQARVQMAVSTISHFTLIIPTRINDFLLLFFFSLINLYRRNFAFAFHLTAKQKVQKLNDQASSFRYNTRR